MAAAGWFPDPERRYEFRFWDGQRWTNQVAAGGNSMLDNGPPAPPPPPAMHLGATVQPVGALAGFWRRWAASLIDGLVCTLFLVPSIPALAVSAQDPTKTSTTIGGVAGFFLVVGGLAAFITLYLRKVGGHGQSWGHKAVGVRVVDATSRNPIGVGRAAIRFFSRALSAAPCYLGLLWMLWDPQRQTWHDKIAKSLVIKTF